MIQAPQAYTPVQQPYYRYPAQPQCNAVNIQILEPKSYAAGAQPQAQPSVYTMPQNSVYTMPTQPVYIPAQPQPPQIPAPAQTPIPVPPPQVVNTQTVNNVPPSVVPPQTQAPEQTAQTAPVTPPPAPEATPAANTIDTKALASQISSSNYEEAGAAIEKVADIAQNQPSFAGQLLDQQLMESLLGVIAQDNSQLQDVTPKQLELRQQLAEGKTLSAEDMTEAQKISDKEMSDRNKQYALFTVAIIQDLLVKEFQKDNNVTPDIKDLPGMEQITTTVKDNSNPMLRASGLAALAYNARPEYKPVLQEIFELSKQYDEDPNVRKVAEDGLNKLAEIK